jgi:hypothetical protein
MGQVARLAPDLRSFLHNTVSRSFLRRQRVFVLAVLCTVIFSISSCASQPEPSAFSNPPGFWFGLLHGILIVFSFIGSLFTDARIYAFPNSGVWYDFGYLLGASMFLGGAHASAGG